MPYHDSAADGSACADADGRATGQSLALVCLLVVIGAHNHGVLNRAPGLHVGPLARA